jgi:hypothetical protein
MTPDEQLEHERHIARLLEIRQPPVTVKSPKLDTWANSSVLAAIIGVVGTAILGACVSGMIQDRSKRNELELAESRETRAARAAAVEKVLAVVGQNLNATDDLLVTVNNGYNESRHRTEDVPRLQEWKRTLAERRDKADSDWRQTRRSLGYTLLYHFGGNTEVQSAWNQIVSASDQFERCTRDWYWHNAVVGSDEEVPAVCRKERAAYEAAIENLTLVVTGVDAASRSSPP